ncbi:MAG: YdeI/OmpD-associated family protein, partial [Prolixibacteraceae bacterium]|nr:YdeI/OmpD-associated family protein [Prolixibacteraceae bacterium]
LCFGWIDSIQKSYDEKSRIQRYSVRNPKSSYSQLNKERVRWLHNQGMIHPSVIDSVRFILEETYVFPEDILQELQKDSVVWENYNLQSESYRRIRIAYIDHSRISPEHFQQRLHHFIEKTRDNKLIKGYGGTDKYYEL